MRERPARGADGQGRALPAPRGAAVRLRLSGTTVSIPSARARRATATRRRRRRNDTSNKPEAAWREACQVTLWVFRSARRGRRRRGGGSARGIVASQGRGRGVVVEGDGLLWRLSELVERAVCGCWTKGPMPGTAAGWRKQTARRRGLDAATVAGGARATGRGKRSRGVRQRGQSRTSLPVRSRSCCCQHGGSLWRLHRRPLVAALRSERLRGPARATRARSAQRFGAALLVDQRAHERAGPAIARTVEHGIGEGAGSATEARRVAFGHADGQVDQAREGAGELQRDREERADGRRCAGASLRGKKPPVGRLPRRRAVGALS